MKPFVLILAVLCIWTKLAHAVINNGLISFDPVAGASRYTLWRALPNQLPPQYMASFTAPPFMVPGPTPDYSTFYVRTIMPTNVNGQVFYTESDFGFVVSPPVATNTTNVLRFIGPTPTLIIQAADSPVSPWSNLVVFTGGPPVQLPMTGRQFIRTSRTNIPPMPPQ